MIYSCLFVVVVCCFSFVCFLSPLVVALDVVCRCLLLFVVCPYWLSCWLLLPLVVVGVGLVIACVVLSSFLLVDGYLRRWCFLLFIVVVRGGTLFVRC